MDNGALQNRHNRVGITELALQSRHYRVGVQGVTIALLETAHSSLLEWDPISLRLTRMPIKGYVDCLAILAVYVATIGANDATKEAVYTGFQRAINQIHRRYLVIAGNGLRGPAPLTILQGTLWAGTRSLLNLGPRQS